MKDIQNHNAIKGWGADLDPADRPAVPMERTPPRIDVPWDKPQKQRQTVEVLTSVEHMERPAVFGSPCPPRGLSGVMRRVAFKRSENDLRHWLMLLAADRVDMVEGILDDLVHGHVPNIFAEMGWRAKWKYNKAGLISRVAIFTALGVGTYMLMKKRREDDED